MTQGMPKLAGDDGTVDEHTAAPLDDGTSQGHQVGHRRLDGIADQHFARPKAAQILGIAHPAHLARGQTRGSRLPDKLARALA